MEEYKVRHDYGDVSVVRNENYEWAVINLQGDIIVPFGKYDWIEGFDHGLSRVRTKGNSLYTKNIIAKGLWDEDEIITDQAIIQQQVREEFTNNPDSFQKWGIINTEGVEVLPLEYDEIWKFYGKNIRHTTVVKHEDKHRVYFRDLKGSEYYEPDDEDASAFEDDYSGQSYYDEDWERDTWDALTDGQYGDYPGGDIDYDVFGFGN